jgi:amidase
MTLPRRYLAPALSLLVALLAIAGCGSPESAKQASTAAKPFELMEATVADVHEAFKTGTLTSRKLVEMYLARIEAFDKQGPAINSVLDLNPKALEQADKLDATYRSSGPIGPLHGIPILLKDQIDAAGMRTTLGSVLLEKYSPTRDAFVVEKLRKAGAIILGKVTLGELGGGDSYGSLYGATRNPYGLERTVGGSSGGTGASLAANFATVGLGQEGSSSIRRPSAWNNIVGMRPTAGLVSRSGVWGGWPSPHGSAGPMARTVEDLAKLLDVMVGYDAEDPLTAHGVGKTPKTYTAALDKDGLKGARIGVIRASMSETSEPASEDFKKVDAVFSKAVEDLKASGAVIVDNVVIPDIPQAIDTRTEAPGVTEASWNDYFNRNAKDAPYKTRAEMYSPENVRKVSPTKRLTSDSETKQPTEAEMKQRYATYVMARDKVWIDILKIMADNQLDALVYKSTEHQPNLIKEATTPPYKRNRGVISLNTFLVFAPVLSVPAGFTSDGLPAGITFTGRPYDELTLFKLAYAYEQATHHRKVPATTPAL